VDAIVTGVLAEAQGYAGKTFSVTRVDRKTEGRQTTSRTLRFETAGPNAGWRQLDGGRAAVKQASLGPGRDEDEVSKLEPPRGYGNVADLLAGGYTVASRSPTELVLRVRQIPDSVFNGVVIGASRSLIGDVVIDTRGQPFVREIRVSNPAPFKARTKFGVTGTFDTLQVTRRFERGSDGRVMPIASRFAYKAKALFVTVDQVNELTFTDHGPLAPWPGSPRRG
jgi:hypothetical protein